MNGTPRESLEARVAELRSEAIDAMGVLTGDVSACARARDGQSFPAYKLHEGRYAAATSLHRELRSAADADVPGLVEHAWETWQAEQERRASQSRDWQAYAAGGLETVTQLRELLGGSSSTGAP
ncbi:hypothetical protein ACI3ET_12740 [Ornithinimicrobium sp. LYQ121]|uniref:hypothetical protein n=1 Tax=Ornithinimicrobium sp. LYQ121 TaxID=3378801 RepID=UPI003855424B